MYESKTKNLSKESEIHTWYIILYPSSLNQDMCIVKNKQ